MKRKGEMKESGLEAGAGHKIGLAAVAGAGNAIAADNNHRQREARRRTRHRGRGSHIAAHSLICRQKEQPSRRKRHVGLLIGVFGRNVRPGRVVAGMLKLHHTFWRRAADSRAIDESMDRPVAQLHIDGSSIRSSRSRRSRRNRPTEQRGVGQINKKRRRH